MTRPSTANDDGAGHGTGAVHPWQIPLRGWVDIARRIGHEILRDHVFIASSGVAFLAIFALLPTLTALISVYGMVTSPHQLQHQLQMLHSFAPQGVIKALRSDMHGIVRDSGLKLGFGIVLSILAAVWVSVRGVLGIISALNIVYDENEKRSWAQLVGTATALAVGAIIFWIIALVVIIGAPFLINKMTPDSTLLHALILAARWLVMAATALISMTVLYRFGPSHTQPHWEWMSAGSIVGTLLWLAVSAGLSAYMSHVGSFGHVYGSLGILMVVQTWFFLTALVFLLGAEFNIEVERQTRADIRD